MSKINIFKILLIVGVVGGIVLFAYNNTITLPPPPNVQLKPYTDEQIDSMWEKHQDSLTAFGQDSTFR